MDDPNFAEGGSAIFHTNPLNDKVPYKGSVPDIILDEIALDGLDGITISGKKNILLEFNNFVKITILGLWIRLSEALYLPLPLLNSFRIQTWDYILSQNAYLDFYELPEPRAGLKTFVRKDAIDDELGLPIQPVNYIFFN